MLRVASGRWARLIAPPARFSAGPTVVTGTGVLSSTSLLDGAGSRIAVPINRIAGAIVAPHGRLGRFLLGATTNLAPPGSQFGTGALSVSSFLTVQAGRGFNDRGWDVLIPTVTIVSGTTVVTYSGAGVLQALPAISASAGVGRRSNSAVLALQAVISASGVNQVSGSRTGAGALVAAPVLSGVGSRRFLGAGVLIVQPSIVSTTSLPIFGTGNLAARPTISGVGSGSQRWQPVTKPASNWTRLTAVA